MTTRLSTHQTLNNIFGTMSNFITRADYFFLVVSFIFGTLMVFIIPIGIGYDEGQHFARIWEIALFELMPNEWLTQPGNGIPAIFSQMSYRNSSLIEPVSSDFWSLFRDAKIDTSVTVPVSTRSSYSPLLYFIPAMILRLLGLKLNFPAICVYYLCRLSYIWIYCLLTYLAIKLLPFGKWLMAVLALAPMALIQATTLNPEAIQNAGCFLFIAWVLYLVINAKGKPFTRVEMIITILLVILLLSLKINAYPLLLLLFLIPATKFRNIQQRGLFFIVVMVLFFILGIGWNVIAIAQITNSGVPVALELSNRANLIFANPLKSLISVIIDPIIHADKYIIQWIGVLPTGYWKMPALVYFLFPTSLFIAWHIDRNKVIISYQFRFKIIFIFLLSFFTTILIFAFGEKEAVNMGRYFIGYTPLLFLAMAKDNSGVHEKKQHFGIIMGCILTTSFITMIGMWLSYHVPCGMWYYTFGKCYMPIYKNWNPNINQKITVDKEISLDQIIESGCNNFDGIRLWTFYQISPNKSSMNIEVREYQTNKIIAIYSIPSDQIKNNDWMEIKFPKISYSYHQRYLIHVYSDTANNEISIAMGEPFEYRFNLLVNGKLMERALLFQQRCAIGLDNLLSRAGNK